MVIEDLSLKPNQVEPSKAPSLSAALRDWPLASPRDRLAAAIIDICMVLTPLVLLLIAPFRRVLMEAMIVHNEMNFMLYAFYTFLLGSFFIWLYQALTHYFYGASLGKLVMGLKVVSVYTQTQVNFWQCGWRALLWMSDVFLVIPTMSVFSHSHRRTLHDRWSDTIVVSTKRPVGSPDPWESAMINGAYAALFAFALLTLLGVFQGWLNDIGGRAPFLSLLEEKGQLCATVGKALENWPEEKVNHGMERLSTAMALFASGAISKVCLAQEAEFVSGEMKEEDPLLYLAQAFVYSDQAALSDEYLDRVCELDSESNSCQMSKVISDWSLENWDKVDEHFQNLKDPSHLHVKIWFIRHLMRRERFSQALSAIDMLSPQKYLAPFFNLQRVKALWNLQENTAARSVAAASLDLMDTYDNLNLSSWLCQEEMDADCDGGSQSLSCRAFETYIKDNEDLLADTDFSLARMEQVKCRNQIDELQRLSETVPQPRAREYALHVLSYLQGKPQAARKGMKQLSSANDKVGLLATRRFIEWSRSRGDLEEIVRKWKTDRQKEGWRKIGKSLFETLYSMGDFAQALQIGKDLVSSSVANEQFYRQMTLSAYHVGDSSQAKSFLKVYENFRSAPEEGRSPASVEDQEFRQIARKLKGAK